MKLLSSKKAALELSINGIVILILAITILGLGLAFIKGQFGSLTESFTKVSAELERETIREMEQTGELVYWKIPRLNARAGTPQDQFFAIRNTDSDTKCFLTFFVCESGLKDESDCDPTQRGVKPVVVGCKDAYCDSLPRGDQPPPSSATKWFTTEYQRAIDAGKVGVFPVKLLVPSNVPPDTYRMSIQVIKGILTGGQCDFGEGAPIHDTKSFFIELTG